MAFTPTADTPSGRVWTKARWADDWRLAPHLVPTQSSSLLSPELSTATLHCSYGHGLLPGDSVLRTVAPVTGAGYFVLIQWFDAVSSRWWLGYAGRPVTTPLRAAAAGLPAAGTQRIPCYGLERTFQMQRIDTTVRSHKDGPDWVPLRNETGSTFNADGRGNRFDDDDLLVFALPRCGRTGTRPDLPAPTWWTSRQIVGHLLLYHLPRPTGIAVGIPWEIGDLSPVPTWDQPTLDTDGRTLAECLDDLLSRDRMLGWRLVPQITPPWIDAHGHLHPPIVTGVTFQATSRSATPIVLPNLGTLPAASSVHALHTGDPLTRVDVTEDASDLVDQVIVEGPPEIAVCTLRPIRDWSTADHDRYIAGASGHPDYAAAPHWQRLQMDAAARSETGVDSVWRRYNAIPPDWNGWVNATIDHPAGGQNYAVRVFPLRFPGDTPHPYAATVRLLPDLPLYDGVDYTQDPTTIDESAGTTHRPIMPYVQRVVDPPVYPRQWDRLADLGGAPGGISPETPHANFRVSLDVDHHAATPGVRIEVSGAPRHALAEQNAGPMGRYYDGNLWITCALVGNRRPRHQIPAAPDALGRDFFQTRTIRIDHPALQVVTIAPWTVVDLDSRGRQRWSMGGTLRDPSDLLRSLAILAAQAWTLPSQRVDCESARLMPAIQAGDVITHVDGVEMSAAVLEVRVDAPIGDGADVPAAITTRITAASTRVDPVRLIRPDREPDPA